MMKIKIQPNNGSSLTLEIPASLRLKQLAVGEKFTLFLLREGQKVPINACFIADKQSLLLQDTIVRLTALKNIKNIQTELVRPVEPKRTQIKRGTGELKSPMTGKIISVAVKETDYVKKGSVLLVVEAMKMENRLLAEGEGVVKNIRVTPGMNVTAGDILLTVAAENGS